jgi:bidirectional [NiFe] hydrogenase diaphorase subunit
MDHDQLQHILESEKARAKPIQVRCCVSSGCRASGGVQRLAEIKALVEARNLSDQIQVVPVGCPGMCSRGPLVEVYPKQLMFSEVAAEHTPAIVEATQGKFPSQTTATKIDLNHPFFSRQRRVVRASAGKIDPERLEAYISVEGYAGLLQALQQSPSSVVDTVIQSGLRGRGGAGYPTGLKWATVAKMPTGQKYVVCNGDEGDPGAFMDRSVMEDAPHQVIEGMAIAGYAVGANQGYIYVRAEYPLAIERLERAIKQANKAGLLGHGFLKPLLTSPSKSESEPALSFVEKRQH